MDIEEQLRRLESQYQSASTTTVAAKAHYLALKGAQGISPDDLLRAKVRLQKLEARKLEIAKRMGDIEDLDQDAVA